MITRTITGLVGAAVAIMSLVFLQLPLLGLLVIPFAALSCYEICHAVQMKNKPMIAVATVVAAVLPPTLEYNWLARIPVPAWLVLLCYFFLLVVLLLAQYEKTQFAHVLFALVASLGVPAALSALILLRNTIRAHEQMRYEQNLAVYFLFFALCCAWLTDTCAYFVGSKLGKHKLCPKISPKKSVEGAVGGLAGTLILNIGFVLLFNACFLTLYRVRPLTIALLTIPIGIVSMIGDLSASVLKRNFGAKDYGKLFPGHGGAMDRFDSLIFVAPLVLGLVQLQYSLGQDFLFEVLA